MLKIDFIILCVHTQLNIIFKDILKTINIILT